MALIRNASRIPWNRRKVIHCFALDFASKMAELISKVHDLDWDTYLVDKEDFTNFLNTDGHEVIQYILALEFQWQFEVFDSPKFWLINEENFETRVYAMLEETRNRYEGMEKEYLFYICARIFIIAAWFIKHDIVDIKDTVIDIVYKLTLRVFRNTPIYSSIW